MMIIPEIIERLAHNIRTKIYGRDVRESIASGIEAAGGIAEDSKNLSNETKERQDDIEQRWDEQIQNLTVNDPSSAEIVDARGNYSVLRERLDAESQELEQKAKKQENHLIRQLREQTGSILLVGDSITAGVGSSHYSIPGNNPIIFTDTDGTVYREASYYNGGWGSWFRNYIETYYPNTDFRNIAIGGKSTRWFYDRRDLIFTKDSYDTIFLATGANDTWDTNNPSQFKQYLTDFIVYLKEKCNYLVLVCTPIRTKKGEETDYFRFSMDKINKVMKEVALEQELPFIDTYTYSKDYVEIYKINEYAITTQDGVHPNDSGYRIMWDYISSQMNLLKPNDQTNDGIVYVDNTADHTLYTNGTKEKPFYRFFRALEYVRSLPKGKYIIHIKQGQTYSDEGSIEISDCELDIVSSDPAQSVNFASLTFDNAKVNFKGYVLVLNYSEVKNNSDVAVSKFYNGGSSNQSGLLVDENSHCKILDFVIENKQINPFVVSNNSVLEIWNIPKVSLNNNNKSFKLIDSVLRINSSDLSKISGNPTLEGNSFISYNSSLTVVKGRTDITINTPANSFEAGKITIIHFTVEENGGFPGNNGGKLTTDLSSGGVTTLVKQYFEPANADSIFVRHWNGFSWSTFKQIQLV